MIKLFITGGTLDKNYNELTGELEFSRTHLPEMLLQANCQVEITTQQLMLKDSLEINDTDRQTILQACLDANELQIIITHGTDTMVQTAKLLSTQPQLKHKTIVLTGAMRPYKLGSSDALFNLGNAISAVKSAQGGIYIAMNGELFVANKVKKDTNKGIFIPQ